MSTSSQETSRATSHAANRAAGLTSTDIGDVAIGAVTDFDSDRGIGHVSGNIAFHVIEIVDGTRSIDVGQRVAWIRRPRFGVVEAAQLVKLD